MTILEGTEIGGMGLMGIETVGPGAEDAASGIFDSVVPDDFLGGVEVKGRRARGASAFFAGGFFRSVGFFATKSGAPSMGVPSSTIAFFLLGDIIN
jgi:hypothetical protein